MSKMDIAEQIDFYNVTVDGIMFTADKCDREWVIGYEKSSAQETERIAASRGMTVDEFWKHYQALLNNAVGWYWAEK